MKPCWAVMLAFQTALDVPFDGAFINHVLDSRTHSPRADHRLDAPHP